MSATHRPIVGVMGSGREPHVELAKPLGELLARLGVHLLTGGGAGVMAAVSEAFTAVTPRQGLAIGVLPSDERDAMCRPKAGYPNPWIELPIATHLPLSGAQGTDSRSRNHINILSADAVVVLPGEAGAASEAQLAVRYGRPVIAYLSSLDFPGLPVEIAVARQIEEVEWFLRGALRLPG